MECPMCLDSFNNSDSTPFIFPCGHTLCCRCVHSLYNSDQKLCPLDRQPLPSQDQVHPNYALIDSMQITATPTPTPTGNTISCCNGHPLQESISVTSKCRVCKKEKKSLWFCIPCHSGMCDKCKDWFDNSTPVRDSAIKCYKGHNLRITQNAGQFYKREGKFLCDGCRKKSNGASAHCRRCNVDYCIKCLEMLNELVSMSLFIKCSCKKQIVWRCKEMCGKCAKCKEKFEKSGCFLCVQCNKKHCVPCAYSALGK